jgi:N-acetylmuramic acid 6-phosphate etherase
MPLDRDSLFETLRDLTTEQRNPRTQAIDMASTREILELMNNEDRRVAEVVRQQIPAIAEAVELVVESFRKNGRLLYVGAGTSGRLGILDAAECPPTFGVNPDQVVGVIAGGRDTVFLSREGIEDDEQAGRQAMADHQVSADDTVIGITASRQTPFVLSALGEAKRRGAGTVFLCCNQGAQVQADVNICIVTGPEAISGSTRLKAATGQKMVLNMITTASMVRLGKVYENLMVDLKPASKKLVERAKGIIMLLTGLDYEAAAGIFEAAGRDVKVAVVMAKRGLGCDEARAALTEADGFLTRAMGER